MAVTELLVDTIAGVVVIAIGTVVGTAEADAETVAVGFEAVNKGRPPAAVAAKGAAGLLVGAIAGIPTPLAMVVVADTPEPTLAPAPGKRPGAGVAPNENPPVVVDGAAGLAVVAINPKKEAKVKNIQESVVYASSKIIQRIKRRNKT